MNHKEIGKFIIISHFLIVKFCDSGAKRFLTEVALYFPFGSCFIDPNIFFYLNPIPGGGGGKFDPPL